MAQSKLQRDFYGVPGQDSNPELPNRGRRSDHLAKPKPKLATPYATPYATYLHRILLSYAVP